MLKEDKGSKDEVDAIKDCLRDPSQAECRKISANAAQEGSSESPTGASTNTQTQKSVKPEDFNVNDLQTNDGYVPSIAGGASEAPTNNVVPNNSGGGIPGGVTCRGRQCTSKSGWSRGRLYDRHLPRGLRGGRLFRGLRIGPDPNLPPDAYRRRKPASDGVNAYGQFKTGTDLKSYLPGGANDPNRMKLGMYASGTASKEIHQCLHRQLE